MDPGWSPSSAAYTSPDCDRRRPSGCGCVTLPSRPQAGASFTWTGLSRTPARNGPTPAATGDSRQLKQRERGEVRTVPCPPELTELLHRHIAEFGTGPDGRLFVGERNRGELPKLTIVRAWQRAREAVFTAEVVASPLVQTPYDLRHAAVSTWLNGGVPATDVAEWAGHSVEIYAKCPDGGEAVLRRRVEVALARGFHGDGVVIN